MCEYSICNTYNKNCNTSLRMCIHWESYIVRCEWHDVLKDSLNNVHIHVYLLGEGVRSPGDGFIGGLRHPAWVPILTPGPLEEQSILFATKSSLLYNKLHLDNRTRVNHFINFLIFPSDQLKVNLHNQKI